MTSRMSSASADGHLREATDEPIGQPPPTLWRSIIENVQGRVGLVLLAGMLALILVGPHVAPHSPTAVGLGAPFAGPSAEHWFGLDSLGRDGFSRFLSGGTTILLVPIAVMVISVLAGGTLGLLGAYRGGAIDGLIVRFFDILYVMPPLLVVLVVIAAFGSSPAVLILSISFVWLSRVGRIVRGSAQAVITHDYVAAAVARGEGTSAILHREVVPNIVPPVVTETALRITITILFVATLNFLGLGAQPPTPDWGVEVAAARATLAIAPIQALAPATAIALLSIAFNLIAEAISNHYSEVER
jgi:peptide/nickel transport system permease protein